MNKNKIIIILILFYNILYGNALKYNIKENYTLNDILNNHKWNQLLYYNNNVSEINTDDFFLTKNGKYNPKEELIETINSYSIENINDDSSICKFPARYYFLSEYIDFKNFEQINKKCNKLNKWEILSKTESISIMLVSGYISNPASTFGHSFVKLNYKEENNLFDSSVSFGALVPENENMLKYIYNGLTGNYQAGFSDKYFYTQDLSYSNTEFRDMWEYKLNLTEKEKNLILLHLYETLTKKFDYYFFNRNCGYRVAELLNLNIIKKITKGNEIWYLPLETFSEIENNYKNLIKEIKYIPSNKKILNYHYSKLNNTNQEKVLDLIKNNFELTNDYINLKEEDKIEILDFLLLYYKQKLIIGKNNIDINIKNKILKERFKYKKSNKIIENIKEKESPTKNTEPININIGVGYSKLNKNFTEISFSPYKQTFLNISNLDSDELIVLDTTIGFNYEDIYLEKFDLIKIKKINTNTNNLLEENDLSWKLNIGTKRIYKKDENRLNTFATFGIGKNINIANSNNYIMMDFTLNDKNEYIRISPNINFDYTYNNYIKNSTEIGYNMDIFNNTNNVYIKENIQYNLSKQNYINYSLEYENEDIKNRISYKLSF